MTSLDISKNVAAPKGTAKRDALRANEILVQAVWERENAFNADAAESGKDGREKFMVTAPYPYSNGHLHLGHAFTYTKSIFRAQFERNRGKNVLWPFAFHCTGMPIQAVSCICGLVSCHYANSVVSLLILNSELLFSIRLQTNSRLR